MAVRNARVVLVDDSGIRATMTASWLIQAGWQDVFVLEGGIGDTALVIGPHAPNIPGFKEMKTLSAQALKEQLKTGNAVALIDVATSREYRQAHIPGAFWIIRSRLAQDLVRIPTPQKFVVTSPDGILAHLVAEELQSLRPNIPAEVLEGGSTTWIDAGYATEKGMTGPASDLEDVCYKPYEFNDTPEAAMKEYLEWEVALVEALEKDGSLMFRRFD
jgi:rhodanese-related sulfurtransferase